MIEEHKITTTVQDILDDMEEGISYVIDINIGMDIYFQIFYNSGIMHHCNRRSDDGRCTQSEFDSLMKMPVKHITYVEVSDLDSEGNIGKNRSILQPLLEIRVFL